MPRLEALEDRLAPAVLTVNTLADETTADNSLSLREAIGVVNNGKTSGLSNAELTQVSGTLGSNDTIQFSLPSGPQTITLTNGALNITRSVAINGPGASNLTISGNNADRVFLIGQIWSQNLSLVVSLSGLTATGGNVVSSTNDFGGGVLNFGTLTMSNCTVAGNAAGAGGTTHSEGGGGIYNVGALTLNGCALTNNTAIGNGGALNDDSAGTLTVSNCTFTGNTVTGSYNYGGGIINSGTSTTSPCDVSNSTFSNNSATGGGGGIFNDSSAPQLTVHNCTFSGNRSGADGGGLDDDGQSLTVTDCTFSGNTAASNGGGLQNWKATLSLRNCTFSGNTAAYGGGVTIAGPATVVNCTITANRATGNSGGGLYYYNSTASGKVFNTVVAGNYQGSSGTTPGDVAGTLDPGSSSNLIGTGGSGGLSNGVNGNQVGVSNPGLGALANNGGPTQTIALLSGSPAIDHGGNAYVNAGETDQRGLTRIANGTVDVGAFEVQATSSGSFRVTGFPSPTTAGVAGSFTITVLDTSGNVATGYRGTVHFTSSDGQAVLPADYTFTAADNGVHTFSATLKTAGTQSLTATDTATSTITGSQTGITVTPAAAVALRVGGFPSSVTAGVAGSFTVTALDAYGNVATGYRGTVHFTSSDGQAALPADYTFTAADNGVHAFSATLNTLGTQSLTATDTATSTITGSATVTVNPAAPTNLTATAVSSTQINLTWQDNSSNETGFLIERSTDGVNWTQVATVGPNVTSYSDTGGVPGLSRHTKYYYRVSATSTSTNSAYSNVASATTLKR